MSLPKVTQVRRLDAGSMHLPSHLFISEAPPSGENERLSPSMAWLITHPSQGHILFDLGLNKDTSTYPPAVQHRLKTVISTDVSLDVFDSLKAKGVEPEDIKWIILSHLHYDHTGVPKRFKNAKVLVGPGALSLLTGDTAYPKDPESIYDSDLFLPGQATELPAPESNPLDESGQPFWERVGPFPEAHKLFAENWIYIVNSPGHLAGHINLFVRASSNKWVFLAGDTCHDVTILDGTSDVAFYPDPSGKGMKCAHQDNEEAEVHLKRVRKFRDMGVEVILSHDWRWMDQNADRFQ
ncbi:Metallo-hydrolase/oxidoreductase [Eremomyces bilateralis CBS 781.70]|uniref:Metallo-hydrolase/oxidoreductase n=1 Tax=Eremomyces bilateralis CBS 781.70 TaxID=1392243 RepID=A0A6G1FSF2_9PEZI|nr:Metallo-hydrolase/oxidoreductase [Eremomyces bilateralis CBS 781.70]KAF1808602.1 Metallo-hydrolase/oxidoreductase [Eremomyces bilateralis CBS 781.70]